MKKSILIVAVVVAVLAITIGVAAAAESRTAFRANLEASVMGSTAHGNAIVVFKDDGSELSFKLVVNGLDDPTMAHIHVAAEPGLNGPPVLWLYPDGPPPTEIPGTFNGLLGNGSATSADLTGNAGIDSLDALRMAVEEGRAYVNVHTTTNPGGEIRGTLQ